MVVPKTKTKSYSSIPYVDQHPDRWGSLFIKAFPFLSWVGLTVGAFILGVYSHPLAFLTALIGAPAGLMVILYLRGAKTTGEDLATILEQLHVKFHQSRDPDFRFSA
jgi:hypothetical protein